MTAPHILRPTPEDAKIAAKASRALSGSDITLRDLRVGLGDGTAVRLPEAAADLLQVILAEMARGRAVCLVRADAELTTQEAADYLNVSRPFLIRLLGLGDGQIPYRKVGTHRRVLLADLEAYRRNAELSRENAMQELADEAQEMEIGYQGVALHGAPRRLRSLLRPASRSLD